MLGSAVGLVGVGLASCAAGQASAQCSRFYSGQPMASLAATKREDLLVDAAMGIVLFKVEHTIDTRKLTW